MLAQQVDLSAQVDAGSVLGNSEQFAVQLSAEGHFMSIVAGDMLLSRTLGSQLEGGLARMFLREHSTDGIRLHCLQGAQSALQDFSLNDDSAQWSGELAGLSVVLRLEVDAESASLLWSVDLQGQEASAATFDVVWVQDIGNAALGALQSNEAYTAHYLDESVFKAEDCGPVLAFRQNLKQGAEGQFPWVMAACLSGAASYATDAFDIYGNGYRCGEAPAGLMQTTLVNRRYQYEFSCVALQSKPIELDAGKQATACFGLTYQSDHPEASSEADLAALNSLRALASKSPKAFGEARPLGRNRLSAASTLHGRDLSRAELEDLFQHKWRHLEADGEMVLGFFCDADTHVVTRAKESRVERPHGSILVGNAGTECMREVLATTVSMSGVFAAQTVYGNTSFHKWNSLPREPLGLSRSAGLRIYVETDAGWSILGTPSVFQMERDQCRWVYVTDMGTLAVRVAIDVGRDRLEIAIDCDGAPRRYMLTNELVMGAAEAELNASAEINEESRWMTFSDESTGLANQRGMDLAFAMGWSPDTSLAMIGGAELLEAECDSSSFVVMVTESSASCSFRIAASLNGADDATRKLCEEASAAGDFWEDFNRGLECNYEDDAIVRLSDALRWYSHNALIHYASPHGLEQYSGAAWGTRDACQGPFEYFIAQQHYGLAKSIVLKTFGSQYLDTGDWPQWFMHDEYFDIAQHHSHGDIVVWPLKALAMYLEATGDLSVLDIELPYLNADNTPAETKESLVGHINRTLDRIEHEFVPGTNLIRYGGGDWDDSLQPVSSDLAARLVSGWTVGLLAQSLAELSEGLASSSESALTERIQAMAAAVRKDFRECVLIDGQVAGFLLYDEAFETAEPLLHPNDTRTGVQNRLIPMTRSVIAGLLTREEADHQMQRIAENLKFPDGVRLMDRPAPYQGGLETFFRRAESAANFGREIGLQYVHAHIRYAEALAKLGEGDAFFQALLTICPISIEKTVPNAEMRQSNMYFSSSDAAFLDRADAAKNFAKLKDGSITVKGGWRLYSSGPGLYSGLVIRQLFGLRETKDAWIFDPVLPKELDGIVLTWELCGQAVEIEYKVCDRTAGPSAVLSQGVALPVEREHNPYRDGGLVVAKSNLNEALASKARLTVQL